MSLPSLPTPLVLLDTQSQQVTQIYHRLEELRKISNGIVPDAFTPPSDLNPPPMPAPPYESVDRRLSTVSEVANGAPLERPSVATFSHCESVQQCVGRFNEVYDYVASVKYDGVEVVGGGVRVWVALDSHRD
nr:uncharacterized protein CI109_003643 [Kwoniella shandongensis]KAA5527988.1 hypothetical protein CI109_003643 [Kwoniella shandongensis]